MSIAVNMVKEEMYSTVRDDALVRTEERIVDSLLRDLVILRIWIQMK